MYDAYFEIVNTAEVLFWAILDPQNKDDDLNITHGNVRGVVATVLVALYQLMIIIVLLMMMLIRMMVLMMEFLMPPIVMMGWRRPN